MIVSIENYYLRLYKKKEIAKIMEMRKLEKLTSMKLLNS